MSLGITIGTIVGAAAGFYGGRLDNLLMRFVDLMLSLPQLFVLIIMTLLLRSVNSPILQAAGGVPAIILVIGLLSWMTVARLVRGSFLSLKEDEMLKGHLWMAFFPGLMIFITVIAINYVGDGLRDALDPHKAQ